MVRENPFIPWPGADGLMTASMHAQWFGPYPVVNAFQAPPEEEPAGMGLAGRLGESVFCEPGHVPVSTGVPGKSKCFPFSPASAMFVPNWPASRSFPVGPYWGWKELGSPRRRLGQETTVEEGERNRLLAQIGAAVEKVKPLEDLVAWGGRHDPELKLALGRDSTRFFALSNSIAPLFDKVQAVFLRLSDPDPEFWTAPTADEAAAVRQWTTGINEMHRIFEAHRGRPVDLPPGVPQPPGFKAPGAAAPPPAAVLPERGLLGLTTGELAVSAGLAVGLGMVIYTIVS
jgi:hypothetical protein